MGPGMLGVTETTRTAAKVPRLASMRRSLSLVKEAIASLATARSSTVLRSKEPAEAPQLLLASCKVREDSKSEVSGLKLAICASEVTICASVKPEEG